MLLSGKVEEALCYRPSETMSEGEAAEVLLDASLRLIGKAEFELWRCDDKDCTSCEANKRAVLRLKENCELLMALTVIDQVSHPTPISVGVLDNLTETVNLHAAKVFPELDPHSVTVV